MHPASSPLLSLVRRVSLVLVLSLVLLVDVFRGTTVPLPLAHAAGVGMPPQAHMTLPQFLREGRPDTHDHGPFHYPNTTKPVPGTKHAQNAQLASAQPPHMPAISLTLDSTLIAALPVTKAPTSPRAAAAAPTPTAAAPAKATTGPSVTPTVEPAPVSVSPPPAHQADGSVDLVSRDGQLEVQIPPAAIDLSGAVTASGAVPTGSFQLQIQQLSGLYLAASTQLAAYQFQVVDGQGHALHAISLRHPFTLRYHYQPEEMQALGLDAGTLRLSWPELLSQARQARQNTAAFVVPLHNDTHTHTLTAQSSVLDVHPLVISGEGDNQAPPKLLLAEVGGNAGQLSYSYPFDVPPGPAGFAPQLQLTYSSQATNERTSQRSPADSAGDGWNISLGSITAQSYPSGSAAPGTWYFLSGVDNVDDRLVPFPNTTTFYDTMHISHLRINYDTSRNCFQIWDLAGNYYELGCTSDSLHYSTDSTGHRTNYRWDLNRILAPYNASSQVKEIKVFYVQDSTTSGSYTTIRDAGIKQIQYGLATSLGTNDPLSQIIGTVDFHYHLPSVPAGQGAWATAYGTNYNCSSSPPQATTLRCDDEQSYNSVSPPAVMSTMTLDHVTGYVGDDSSASHTAYSYALSYQDTPSITSYYDPLSQVQMAAAGTHLLTSIVPSVYQNGSQIQRPAVNFAYGEFHNTYYDQSHLSQNPSYHYSGQTFWYYLTSYQDLATGVGATISYGTGYNNSNGTPYILDGSGNIVDDRLDPLYCWNQRNNPDTTKRCTGVYDHPDNNAWSRQIVTQITDRGKDTSQSSVPQETTTYNYQEAITATNGCNPITGQGVPAQEADCVGDNWLPPTEQDWQDYYHSEFRGFNGIYRSDSANNLTIDSYYSTEGWDTPESDGNNYNTGMAYAHDVYWGNAANDNLLIVETLDTYPTTQGNTINGCRSGSNSTYTACLAALLSSKTTWYEAQGVNDPNSPWVQTAYTYDDISGSSNFNSATTVYHNKTQETTSSSNAATVTHKWSYQPTDGPGTGSYSGIYFYHVNLASHSEVDDASNHVWQCQDTSYDEGRPAGVPSPAAGWATTSKTYHDCTNHAGTTHSSYRGYDAFGNVVATVDPFGAANSTLYSSQGCTLTTAPAYLNSAWTAGHYTTCTVYDSSQAQATDTYNALWASIPTAAMTTPRERCRPARRTPMGRQRVPATATMAAATSPPVSAS